jgi:hypothetical protein
MLVVKAIWCVLAAIYHLGHASCTKGEFNFRFFLLKSFTGNLKNDRWNSS